MKYAALSIGLMCVAELAARPLADLASRSEFGERTVQLARVLPAAEDRTGSGDCDPSYPTVCIPPFPPDLDCADVPFKSFAVTGEDAHGFDADHDGIGCEPYPRR